ncbi:MAG: hypothetical protein HYW47_00915 [Deltaproteobacteria bacterium]|nr:hypothetical protein [Deltaproteobacteria bacterium]
MTAFKKKMGFLMLLTSFCFITACSKYSTTNHLYPEIQTPELKIYAAMLVIHELLQANGGAQSLSLTVTQSQELSLHHYNSGAKPAFSQTYPRVHSWFHANVVTVDGAGLSSPLSVAGHAWREQRGYIDKPGKLGAPVHNQSQAGLLSSNRLSDISGSSYSKLAAEPVEYLDSVNLKRHSFWTHHSFWTQYYGQVPQSLATVTKGVFYSHTIGFTEPTAPVTLAYYPNGPFQGTIPSYTVDSLKTPVTRILDSNGQLYTDTAARMIVDGAVDSVNNEVVAVIEFGSYQYGRFFIRNLNQATSMLELNLLSTPQKKTTP